MHLRYLHLVQACALTATAAAAQNDYYFDFGASQSGLGAPSRFYAAAAPAAGQWNEVDTGALQSPFPATVGSLVNTTGGASSVTLTFDDSGSGLFNLVYDNPNTFGDDQLLMDDITYFGIAGSIAVDGLAPGTYDVFTYAMAPDNASYATLVSVPGSPDPDQPVAGDFSNGHQLGETHALHGISLLAGETLVIEFSIVQSFISINGLQIVEVGPPPSLGTPYCVPAVSNSTGVPGALSAIGSAVVLDNDVTLLASDLPLNQFGYFLTSTTPGLSPMAGGSQGTLCLSGAIGRFNFPGQVQSSGASGSFSLMLDLPNTPTPTGFISVLSGETRRYQCWYRDVNPNSTSNFTQGLEISFL